MPRIKHLLPLTTAALAFALAQPATAADGTITFTGELIAASCKIKGGPGTEVPGTGASDINVNLGKVSLDSLNAAGGNVIAARPINLEFDCADTATGLKTVRMVFDPRSGSGVDAQNPSLLQTTGSATGVGIGLYDESGTLLNLAAGDGMEAALEFTGTEPDQTATATINLRAGYVKNGAAVNAGDANGTLPFTLTYE